MYKIASDNAQRAVSRIGIQSGDQGLTPEQERESLVAVWKQIEAELVEIPKHPRFADKRKAVIARKREIEAAMHAIRPKFKGPTSAAQMFVELCRETMPPGQFKALMSAAIARFDAAQSIGCVPKHDCNAKVAS